MNYSFNDSSSICSATSSTFGESGSGHYIPRSRSTTDLYDIPETRLKPSRYKKLSSRRAQVTSNTQLQGLSLIPEQQQRQHQQQQQQLHFQQYAKLTPYQIQRNQMKTSFQFPNGENFTPRQKPLKKFQTPSFPPPPHQRLALRKSTSCTSFSEQHMPPPSQLSATYNRRGSLPRSTSLSQLPTSQKPPTVTPHDPWTNPSFKRTNSVVSLHSTNRNSSNSNTSSAAQVVSSNTSNSSNSMKEHVPSSGSSTELSERSNSSASVVNSSITVTKGSIIGGTSNKRPVPSALTQPLNATAFSPSNRLGPASPTDARRPKAQADLSDKQPRPKLPPSNGHSKSMVALSQQSPKESRIPLERKQKSSTSSAGTFYSAATSPPVQLPKKSKSSPVLPTQSIANKQQAGLKRSGSRLGSFFRKLLPSRKKKKEGVLVTDSKCSVNGTNRVETILKPSRSLTDVDKHHGTSQLPPKSQGSSEIKSPEVSVNQGCDDDKEDDDNHCQNEEDDEADDEEEDYDDDILMDIDLVFDSLLLKNDHNKVKPPTLEEPELKQTQPQKMCVSEKELVVSPSEDSLIDYNLVNEFSKLGRYIIGGDDSQIMGNKKLVPPPRSLKRPHLDNKDSTMGFYHYHRQQHGHVLYQCHGDHNSDRILQKLYQDWEVVHVNSEIKPSVSSSETVARSKRSVCFSNEIYVNDTFASWEYPRSDKKFIKTRRRMMQTKNMSFITAVKFELNEFKKNEMEVHESSAGNTHIFV